jgi:uncharacterized membrane protein YedE/YeeE
MFDSPEKLALGLLSGIIFGFLLQKGRVAKYEVIVGQFLLKDWTVVKVMASAVLVGTIGIYALLPTGAVSLHIKPLLVGGVISGAVLFGIGIVLLGYCPGTTVAACGEGRRDAMVGLFGMLCGAGLFVWLYPKLQPLMQAGDLGKITLPEALGVSPWLIIGGLILAAGIALLLSGRDRSADHRQPVAPPARHSSRTTT